MVDAPRPRIEIVGLEDLVRDVKRGRYRVPAFQRRFSWSSGAVANLFDSVLAGLPIGTLLLHEQSAPAESVTIGNMTIDAPASEFTLAIIDGGQRIASLVGVLDSAHHTNDPRFRVYFDLDTAKFRTPGSKPPPRNWIAVSYLFDTSLLLRWFRDNHSWLSESQLTLADRAARALRDYRIPTYIMRGDEQRETPTMHEVFARINSSGQHLTAAELNTAAHIQPQSPDARRSLHNLSDISDISAKAGFGTIPPDMSAQLLRAFRGMDIYDGDLSEFLASAQVPRRIREIRDPLLEVIRFLRGAAGITHMRLIPHPAILPILFRFVKVHGAPTDRAMTLLRRWIWRAAITANSIDWPSRDSVRLMMSELVGGTQVESAQRLLRHVTSSEVPMLSVNLTDTDTQHPATRVVILSLLSTNPIDPTSGEPVDVIHLMSQASPLHPIVAADTRRLAETVANMAVVVQSDRTPLADALLSAPPSVAESHLIDVISLQLLARGAVDEFLERRADAVVRTVREHAFQLAEWGARDGDSISDLLRSGS